MLKVHYLCVTPSRCVLLSPLVSGPPSLAAAKVFNSLLEPRGSLLQAAAVVVRDGPLVFLRGVYVVRDPRVLVAAEVVAARRLGVVQELPGKQGLHLQRGRRGG